MSSTSTSSVTISTGSSTVTSTSGPTQPTSAPPDGWPALPPQSPPVVKVGDDGVSYFTNTTIDDFSPLVVFSNREVDWVTPRSDSNVSTTAPTEDRNWFLGTYARTEKKNATVKIEFWGSEIHLYGDKSPAYGAFSLTLDNQTTTLHTAFDSKPSTGRAQLLHALRNLTETKHELTITTLGTREGLNEGPAFLFDFAIATQNVGGPSLPEVLDVSDSDLIRSTVNGSWGLTTYIDDVPPGEGGVKPAIYLERKALWSTDNWSTWSRTFRGTGIQVYGGRNATHGSYLARLVSTVGTGGSPTVVHSKIYDASAPCDPRTPEGTPECEWRGSTLKFAVSNLDPSLTHRLTLQNIHQDSRQAIEFDLIRIFGPQLNASGGPEPALGAARTKELNPAANVLALVMVFVTIWRALKF